MGKSFEINFCIGRDLEKRIANLEELNGYEAPRTGGEARLNTKIAGLFLHYTHKQNCYVIITIDQLIVNELL
jgi:hypothetical protein